jgi:hypothetical protein
MFPLRDRQLALQPPEQSFDFAVTSDSFESWMPAPSPWNVGWIRSVFVSGDSFGKAL